ncbi:MAG: winged helix-turn-helix transcriptional regulator [Candidatus Thalassarchaeaceae archaeon]|jgi:DNA-binding Lrp family transcriptional regulator|nr:winged helix-turn-helix transcriptional regulator [Candidatus Thalassarchaeaceae archaeon]MDP7659537.1 winged helix-turn-helix transcriptional regulator [Candidatus Thalassarchaeaceae archaeon]
MALDASQLSELLKLRGIGWSQQEIAEKIGTSQQVVAYQLKKLKEDSLKGDPEDVFNRALVGGLAVGAGIGAAAMMLAQLLKK